MKIKSLLACLGALSALCEVTPALAQTGAIYSDTNPSGYSLSLGSTYRFDLGYVNSYVGFNLKPVGSSWAAGTDTGNNGAGMITGGMAGGLKFITLPSSNPSNPQTFTDAQLNGFSRMEISPTGQVRIGLTAPTGTYADYMLSVDGKFVSKSVYVTSAANWADFVFEPSYEPMALPTLENYLLKNKHLPYIPSAKEVETNGYNVAEMDAKLLQTVEELTLQVIALGKQNESLQAKVSALQAQVASQAVK